MCGRSSLKAEADELISHFEITDGVEYFVNYQPRSEIFPGTNLLTINNSHLPEDVFWTMREPDFHGDIYPVINAKAENLLKAAMFKEAFMSDRVLIPATALFEWQVQPDKSKKKFKIWFDDDVFAFAGIARESDIQSKAYKGRGRCGVIITTTPNEIFSEIHNTRRRQAVVIRPEDYDTWLDPKTPLADLQELLIPLPSNETHFEEVLKNG